MSSDDRRARTTELRRWLTAAAIFVIGLLMRVTLIDQIHFAGDEARFWGMARDIAEGVTFPALGPSNSSGGNLPGPLFYVVMAVPQLFSRAPEASAALVALLGAISSVLLYDGLRRPFGEWGGITAGLIYAVAPWATLTNCAVWTPYTALSVITIALWAALRVREYPRSRLVAVAVMASACMPQFHLTGVVTWLGLFIVAGPALRRLNWRWLGVGLLGSVILYSPGIYSELESGFENVSAVLAAEGRYRGSIQGGYEWTPLYALRFLSTDVSYFLYRGYYGGLDETEALTSLLEGHDALPFHPLRFAALSGSMIFALLCAVWPLLRRLIAARRSDRTSLALFLAAATGIAGTMFLLESTGQQIFAHYALVLVPSLVALSATVAQSMARRRVGQLLLASWLVIFSVASLDVNRHVATFDARHGLEVQRAVVERVLEDNALEGDSGARIQVMFRGPTDETFGLLAQHAYDARLGLDRRGSRLYRLQEKPTPPPSSFVGEPVSLPTVELYRMR